MRKESIIAISCSHKLSDQIKHVGGAVRVRGLPLLSPYLRSDGFGARRPALEKIAYGTEGGSW
jgi:hypothetical protein